MITFDDIYDSLLKLGLKKKDTVLIFSSLASMGRLEGAEDKNSFCSIYYRAIQKVIGDDGTIVVPTYTGQVGRFGVPFVLESTPSLTGIFAEYIREKKYSIRSIHPLNSISAIGKNKEFICSNNSTSAFGWDSPFHRLHNLDTKILSLGLSSAYAMANTHYIEAMSGLPYIYNKLLDVHPEVKGKILKNAYSCSARHLNIDFEYDYTRWGNILFNMKKIAGIRLGKSYAFMTNYRDIIDVARKNIINNPFFFLKNKPQFILGEIPFDGSTASRDKSNMMHNNNKDINWGSYYLGHMVPNINEDINDKIVNKNISLN